MQSETLKVGLLAFVLLARSPYIGRSVVRDASLARLQIAPIFGIERLWVFEDSWLWARDRHSCCRIRRLIYVSSGN